MRIEDLRGLHTGDVAAWLGRDDIVLAAFHQHANQAHWHTVNCLLRLSGERVDGVTSDVIGIVEWWRTIESLTALLYGVALRESELGLRAALARLDRDSSPGVLQKWSTLARWFSEGTDSAPNDVTGRMEELRDFRNSFEHSSREDRRGRRHSRLSEKPATANEFDLLEALAICISCCQYVRHALPANDVMPEVVIPTDDGFFFEKLDVVSERLLVPLFKGALNAMGLETSFTPYPQPRTLRGHAEVEVRLLIRHEDDNPLPALGTALHARELVRSYGNDSPLKPVGGQFRVPNYSRK
jgi:hypothetical protein